MDDPHANSVKSGDGAPTRIMKPRYCYLCRSSCKKDDYCHGCKKCICSRCDKNNVIGPHEPEAHRASPGEEGEQL
jgi:hypothetical protein